MVKVRSPAGLDAEGHCPLENILVVVIESKTKTAITMMPGRACADVRSNCPPIAALVHFAEAPGHDAFETDEQGSTADSAIKSRVLHLRSTD